MKQHRAGVTATLVIVGALPLALLGVQVPNSFGNGSVADASQVNANFERLAGALSRCDIRDVIVDNGAGPGRSGATGHTKRVLNTTSGDCDFLTFDDSNDRITLCPGRYRVKAAAHAYRAFNTFIYLRQHPSGTAQITGPGDYVVNADNSAVLHLDGDLTVTGSCQDYELWHFMEVAGHTGFAHGYPHYESGFENVFAQLLISKLE